MFSSKPRRAQLSPLAAPVLLAVLLAGCTPPAASEKAASAPAPASAPVPAAEAASAPAFTAQEQAVMKRAQERWDALVARDFERAWTYLDAATRETVKQAEYKNLFGSAGVWKEATALRAKCVLPGRCAAFVRLTTQNLTQLARSIPEITTYFDEEWVDEGGQWNYRGMANQRIREGEQLLPSAANPADRSEPTEGFGGGRRRRASAASAP